MQTLSENTDSLSPRGGGTPDLSPYAPIGGSGEGAAEGGGFRYRLTSEQAHDLHGLAREIVAAVDGGLTLQQLREIRMTGQRWRALVRAAVEAPVPFAECGHLRRPRRSTLARIASTGGLDASAVDGWCARWPAAIAPEAAQ